MKKIILSVLLCVTAYVLAAPPISVSVNTNSTRMFSVRPLRNAPAFVTNNVYNQGQYVLSSGKLYMALSGGLSTNIGPSHGNGTAVVGVPEWYRIPKGMRKGMNLVNDGSNSVYLSIGWPAQAGKGIRLNANGGSFSIEDDSVQDEVNLASGGGTNINITGQEL